MAEELKDLTRQTMDSLSKGYRDILAYNMGERNCIMIPKAFVQFQKYTMEIPYFDDRGNEMTIIFRYATDAIKYGHLFTEEGEHYANGILFGYPPSIVRWYSHVDDKEHIQAFGIEFRSWRFKCPITLIPNAMKYYTDLFSAKHVQMEMKIYPGKVTNDN